MAKVAVLYLITSYNFVGLSIAEFQNYNRLLLSVYVTEDSSQQVNLAEELVLSQSRTTSTPPAKKAKQEIEAEFTVRFILSHI